LRPPDVHHEMPRPTNLLRPRVLIVEDESRLRELLVDVIPDMGFSATAVRSAEEASRMMETDPAEIVMLDLQLPVMGGMDFFERLHQNWPQTQVIIMTGFGDLESARRAIRLDVVDFLSKPFHLRDVEVSLDRARKRIVQEIDGSREEDLSQADDPTPRTLADGERQMILAALERHAGNRTAAAAELGISRRKLHYWLNENAE
jgi:DNA-binding NtrC family response regulator